jgi:murein L,D-transpeptidase YafK
MRRTPFIIFLAGLIILASFSYLTGRHPESQTQWSNNETQSPPERKQLKSPLANPRIMVHKAARKLELYSGEELLRTYRIGLGFSPVDDKKQAGDGATPEGVLLVCEE